MVRDDRQVVEHFLVTHVGNRQRLVHGVVSDRRLALTRCLLQSQGPTRSGFLIMRSQPRRNPCRPNDSRSRRVSGRAAHYAFQFGALREVVVPYFRGYCRLALFPRGHETVVINVQGDGGGPDCADLPDSAAAHWGLSDQS